MARQDLQTSSERNGRRETTPVKTEEDILFGLVSTNQLKGECYRMTSEYNITSNNPERPWTIQVLKDIEHNATVWDWKVDTQIFSKDEWATNYLIKLIAEKITGERIINHAHQQVPDICGCEEYIVKHSECRATRCGSFSMLCSDCPIAEQMQAEKDGVRLVYKEA